MSVIDNKLLVDEDAFIDYMGKYLHEFQDRMGLVEGVKYCKNIGTNNYPLHVADGKDGLTIAVDHSRIVGYSYDDWYKHENEFNNSTLALLKEKGLERVVFYARSIVSFYKGINKDVDRTTFNYLLAVSRRVLYVYLNYKQPHQTPDRVVRDQIANIVKRLDGVEGWSYSFRTEYCNKQSAKLSIPLKSLETENSRYFLVLSCETPESMYGLISDHLERKYNFQCKETPLIGVVSTLVSCAALKSVMEIRASIFNMLPDSEKIKMPLAEHLAIIDALDRVKSIAIQGSTESLHEVTQEAYNLCLDLGLFLYSYIIESRGK